MSNPLRNASLHLPFALAFTFLFKPGKLSITEYTSLIGKCNYVAYDGRRLWSSNEKWLLDSGALWLGLLAWREEIEWDGSAVLIKALFHYTTPTSPHYKQHSVTSEPGVGVASWFDSNRYNSDISQTNNACVKSGFLTLIQYIGWCDNYISKQSSWMVSKAICHP